MEHACHLKNVLLGTSLVVEEFDSLDDDVFDLLGLGGQGLCEESLLHGEIVVDWIEGDVLSEDLNG